MATTRERIRYFVENQQIKPQDFFNKTGLKRGYLDTSHSESAVKDTVIAKILENYQQINPVWLLTGKGEMLSSATTLNEPGEAYKKEGSHLKGILFEDQTVIERKLNLILKKIDDLNELNKDVAEIKKTVERLAVIDEINDEIEKNGN